MRALKPMEMDLHVVIAPIPLHGHTTPTLLLARRLAALGVQVTFVCYQFRLKQLLASSSAAGNGGDGKGTIRFLPLCNNIPPQQSAGGDTIDSPDLVDWIVTQLVGEQDVAEFEELLGAMEPPPSCIISDLPWTLQVAWKVGIPRVAFHPCGAEDLAVAFHAKHLFETGTFPTSKEELVHIPGIPEPLRGVEIFSVTTKDLQDFFKRQSEIIHQSAGVICCSFEELEPEACNALRCNRGLNPGAVPFAAVGPVLDPLQMGGHQQQQQSKHTVLKWLDSQAPSSVLFLCFGSFAQPSAQQLEAVALALISSELPFLWVLHRDALLPHGFEEKTSNRGIVFRAWAPQVAILSHASVGAFATHCGWNSVVESICSGVVMGALPFYEDQRANARLVVDKFRIGLPLCDFKLCLADHEQLQHQYISTMLKKLMLDSGELRKRVSELREAAGRAAEAAPHQLLRFLTGLVNPSQNLSSKIIV